jgi:NADH-quinone oxidoreductase subunit N
MDLFLNYAQGMIPELILISGLCLTIIGISFSTKNEHFVSYSTSVLTFLAVVMSLLIGDFSPNVNLIDTFQTSDSMLSVKFIAALLMLALAIQSRFSLSNYKHKKGEFYLFLQISLLGIFIMSSSANLLIFYLGLELVALSLYTLVGFDRSNSKAAEASMKFYVLGAIASGFLLYGISLVYGATGSIVFSRVFDMTSSQEISMLMIIGMMFILIAILFKFGAFPLFHWVPDAYEGGMLPVSLLLASLSKVASFIFFFVLLHTVFGNLNEYWSPIMMTLGVLSVIYGNVVALKQSNLRRLIGYSTIGHVGFIIVALSLASGNGVGEAWLYTVVYAIMSFALFGILISLSSHNYDIHSFVDLKGLYQSSPLHAWLILIVIFSMAGIPPLLGFHAKLLILQELIISDYLSVAIILVIASLIAAYYYLKVIWFVFFESSNHTLKIRQSASDFIPILACLILVLIGIFPAIFIDLMLQIL